MASAAVQTNLEETFSYAQSPIRQQPQHQDYQVSTDDLKLSMVYDHHDEDELARIRS